MYFSEREGLSGGSLVRPLCAVFECSSGVVGLASARGPPDGPRLVYKERPFVSTSVESNFATTHSAVSECSHTLLVGDMGGYAFFPWERTLCTITYVGRGTSGGRARKG